MFSGWEAMPTISSFLQNLMLKMPLDLEEYSAFSEGQETEAVKQGMEFGGFNVFVFNSSCL